MIFTEGKLATTDEQRQLAGRFHNISVRAYNEREAWPRPRPARDLELAGYAATMRECSMRLSHYGHTAAGLAELVTLFAATTEARLRDAGFNALRDRDQPGRHHLWNEAGRLAACQTALTILAPYLRESAA